MLTKADSLPRRSRWKEQTNLNIDLWQTFQDGFNQIDWAGIGQSILNFLRDTFTRYPIPSLILIAVIALYLLYKISRAVEHRATQRTKRWQRKEKIKHAKHNRRHRRHNHHHDRDDDEGETHNSHRHRRSRSEPGGEPQP